MFQAALFPRKNQLLRMEGKVQSSSDIANIPIRSNFQGQRVLVKDVAQVLDSEEEKRVLGRLNGEEATFVLSQRWCRHD